MIDNKPWKSKASNI